MSKYKLINNYLDQLSNQTACTIVELKLLQRHINSIKAALSEENERIRLSPENLPINPISNDLMPQQATDLIRIKEVIKMVGISKSSIYAFISKGTFPKPIRLGARSVAWQRGVIEAWILKMVKAN